MMKVNRLIGVLILLENKSVREVWQEIEKVMSENPEPIQGMNTVYQYDITGDDNGTFKLLLSEGSARVVEGTEASPDCTLKLSDKNFKKMLVKEGERLSRLFTFASIEEFRQKKDYEYIKSERTTEKREIFLVEEIKRIGIRKALKEIGKSKGFLDFRRET